MQPLPRGSVLRVTSVLAVDTALPLAAELMATRPDVCKQSSPEAGQPLLRPPPASTGRGEGWAQCGLHLCSPDDMQQSWRPAERLRIFG